MTLDKVIDILKKIIENRDNKKFKNVAEKWLENKRNTIKESTYYHYAFIIENYLNPEIGEVNIKKQRDYNFLVNKFKLKLSSKTIRDIMNLLKSILKFYEEEKEINLNFKKINLPKLERTQVKIISKEEKEKLERFCVDENSLRSIGIILCLNTGLRVGEICGLKWENIDIDNKKIYVKEILQRIYNSKEKKTTLRLDKPKTEYSKRAIPINRKIYDILKRLKKNQNPENYFLTGKSTKRIEPRNYQNYFKKIQKTCDIKPHKFHTLRHTFASNCIEVGMDAKSLSEILGHSDVDITLNIYVHSSESNKRKFLDKI